MMIWPSKGASIGTAMKTTAISDWVRAMRSPEKRSRTTANGIVIKPAEKRPCNARKASSEKKSVTNAETSATAA